jgi:hypothetical protein
MTRTLIRAATTLVIAALLVGPSAQARAPESPHPEVGPALGHTTNEWLMMGRNCGASIGGT